MQDLTWLYVLIGVLVAFLIVLTIYGIFAFRKMGIVFKKIDYFVEDLTYKSEMLNSTTETISKISNYFDLFEGIVKQNVKSLSRYIDNNKESIMKITSELKTLVDKKPNAEAKKSKTKKDNK